MLSIWLYGTQVASIEQTRGRLRLVYTERALAKYSLGVPLLSLSLPLRPQPYTHGVVHPFLDGLLPEGEARQVIAGNVGVRRDDTYGLLRAIGRDCAGALVIQPDDEPPPAKPTIRTAAPLHGDELAELVANLRSAPLGVSGTVRVSLGGVQEKLLLTRMTDGSWGRPIDGTPSTHILKPEIATYPQTVENEVFCMRIAKHLGLAVAEVEMLVVGGRKLLVVERYDRVVHPDGSVERVHQEDICQALGVHPDQKYEADHGPTLRKIADLLQTTTPESVEAFLRATVVNVLIGNGDAHAKNFSLLHVPSGALQLTPLYDLMSTFIYGDDRLAMYIDTVRRTTKVTGDRIVNEAARWGMSKRRATEVLADLLARVPDAVAITRAEIDVPSSIPELIEAQLARLQPV